MKSPPILEIEDLSVAFSHYDSSAPPFEAIANVSMSINPGEVVCIVGPSGCGKSTLLNVVAGMVKPTATTDAKITGLVRMATKATQRNRQFGYMFQEDTLLPWKTALQNLALPLQLRKEAGALERARELLDLTGLTGFGDHLPKALSGGMRKRVQMGQLLAQDAEILLMDEPFGALDAQTKVLMQQEFIKVWERDRKTIIFVTHDLTEAILLGDRIFSMSARPGRIKRELKVDIERPRTVEGLIRMPRFAELHQRLWEDLRPEAYRTLVEAGPASASTAERGASEVS